MTTTTARSCRMALLAAAMLALPGHLAAGKGDVPAKQIFGAAKLPAAAPAQSIGFYSKGCLAGGVALPTDGPTWQAMRISRNRRWGHPDLVALVERLSREAALYDGWPGLLVGDISQPRGGPMLSGHASHQVGLDADIWLTPMPSRTLSTSERESISATSMLKSDTLYVDPDRWTPAHGRLLMRAAGYQEVQRIFVHPGIKKKLCDTWTGDRSAMGKIRPYWGHHYHFHIRMRCPADAANCKAQAAISPGDGCDRSLAWWFTDEPWKPADSDKKPPPKREMRLADLPAACARVADMPAPASEAAATYSYTAQAAAAPAVRKNTAADAPPERVQLPLIGPMPSPRPVN